jgi:hypothetical protein
MRLLDPSDVAAALGRGRPGALPEPARHGGLAARDGGARRAVRGGVPSPGTTPATLRAAAHGVASARQEMG